MNGPRVLKVAVGIAEVPKKQTVPRVEIWAAARAWNEIADSPAKWVLRPDANYVHMPLVGEWERERFRKGPNGDLWVAVDMIESKSNNRCESVKVKAHQDKVKILSGSEDLRSFVGNHLADCVASVAAEKALKISLGFEWIARWEKRAFLIARRLAVIESWHWENSEKVPAPVPGLPQHIPVLAINERRDMASRVEEQGHVLRVENQRAICARCHRWRNVKNWKWWTANKCDAVASGAVKMTGGKRAAIPESDESQDRSTAVARPAVLEAKPESISERRKLMVARMKEIRERERNDRIARDVAWGRADVARTNPKCMELHVTDKELPFAVGEGHDIVLCGGFVGCTCCAVVVGWHGHSKLSAKCRGNHPRGSGGPVRRLILGKLPHAQRMIHGMSWPSGEVNPRPMRWRRPVG